MNNKIDTKLVQQLRKDTGSPIKDCVDALKEANNNIDLAYDILKKKSIVKGHKKQSSRESSEGIVFYVHDKDYHALFKINSETDFATRSENFKKLSEEINKYIISNKPKTIDEIINNTEETIAEFSGILGENVNLSEFHSIVGKDIGVYIHHNNTIGVIVDSDHEARAIAMQIAALDHIEYISISDIPKEKYETELSIFKEQSYKPGLSEQMIENISKGKLKKYLSEIVLMEQCLLSDESKKIKDIAGEIRSFYRMKV